MPSESVRAPIREGVDPSAMIAPPRGDGSEGRILLVDDDAAIRDTYSRFLRQLGCVVETAVSGLSALALLGAGSFDLIVSDMNMDGMSGTELLRASGVPYDVRRADPAMSLVPPPPPTTRATRPRPPFRTEVVVERSSLHLRAGSLMAKPRLGRTADSRGSWA